MSTFLYEAYDAQGAIVRGEFEAAGKGEVVEYLLRRSLKPVSVQPLHDTAFTRFNLSFGNRLSPVDILFLVRNLATTIKAGMSIVESLAVLIEDTDRPYLKRVLQTVQADVKNGQSLSTSFEGFRSSFPPAFIGMLKAGEISGALDKTLSLLGTYLVKEYQLRRDVRSAMIYPIVLLCASSAVVALLLIVVLPKLTQSFAQSGFQLPLITRIFIGLSDALRFSVILDIVVVAILVWFFTYFRRTSVGKRVWSELLFRTPVARDVVKKVALTRFARTFGNLQESGIPALEALQISADSIGNARYAEALTGASREIERGTSLSRALMKHPDLFPKVLIGLITVGEKSGSLSEILRTLAEFYEEEVASRLKNLTAVLEPLLLLVMGVVVGAIALSILLPIYQLVGKVG